MSKQHNPLLIITMDGGQEALFWDWINKGYLPTLSKLMTGGEHGFIQGLEQYTEQGIELSLFSGLPRNEHGYYHYRELVEGSYKLRKSNPHLSKKKPFWATLPSARKIAIVDMTELPLIENVNGIQLANWVAHQAITPNMPPLSNPKKLVTEVARFYGKRDKTSEYQANSTYEQDEKSYHTFLRQIKKKGEMIRFLLKKDEFDLIVTGFYEIHRAGHRLWNYNPTVQNKSDQMQDAFLNLYKAVDRELGAILAILPKQINVFFISPFQLKAQYPTGGLMESFCLKLGYKQLLINKNSKRKLTLNPLNIARNIIPESIRIRISKKLGSRFQERLLSSELEQKTDWLHTKLFALPTLYTGLLRVNLKNREPKGVVESEEEYVALLKEVKSNLMQLIDPETGETAVKSITCPYDLYGQKIPQRLPDLFVEWKEKSSFLQEVIHPKGILVQRKPAYFRNSFHLFKGFWIANGPDIELKKKAQQRGLLDFASIFKKLLSQ